MPIILKDGKIFDKSFQRRRGAGQKRRSHSFIGDVFLQKQIGPVFAGRNIKIFFEYLRKIVPVNEPRFFRNIRDFQAPVLHQFRNFLHPRRNDKGVQAQAFLFFEDRAKIAERNVELIRDIGGGQVDVCQICLDERFDVFDDLDRISLADGFYVVADDLQVFGKVVEQGLFAAQIFHLQDIIGKGDVEKFVRIVSFVCKKLEHRLLDRSCKPKLSSVWTSLE